MVRRQRWMRTERALFIAASVALFLSVTWCAFPDREERPWGQLVVCTGLPGRWHWSEDPPTPPVLGGRDPFRPPGTEEPTPVVEPVSADGQGEDGPTRPSSARVSD